MAPPPRLRRTQRAFLDRLRSLSTRVRLAELVDDEALFAFYDDRVGDDVVSTRHFDRWWKRERGADPALLDLTEDIVGEHGIRLDDYPDVWRRGDLELPLTYRLAPGEPLDGVTVHIPLAMLNQVDDVGFDWQIPGYRDELVTVLLRSLPKAIRRELIPLAETTAAVLDRLGAPRGRLVDVLAATSPRSSMSPCARPTSPSRRCPTTSGCTSSCRPTTARSTTSAPT